MSDAPTGELQAPPANAPVILPMWIVGRIQKMLVNDGRTSGDVWRAVDTAMLNAVYQHNGLGDYPYGMDLFAEVRTFPK